MLNICQISKLTITIILNIFILLLCSCQKYDIENGKFFVKAKSKISSDDSLEIAQNKIYAYLTDYISEQTKRSDTNIIYYGLLDSDVLSFDDYQIISNKSFASYNTSIKINDTNIQNRLTSFINSFQRYGKIQDNNQETTYRAYASIDYPNTSDLYTKSVLERDAFGRAVNNIKKQLLADNISDKEASIAIENAYIVEETFGEKMYTVVVEAVL